MKIFILIIKCKMPSTWKYEKSMSIIKASYDAWESPRCQDKTKHSNLDVHSILDACKTNP